jgi:hypothetical protein
MSKNWDVRTAAEYALVEGKRRFVDETVEVQDDRDKALKLLVEFNLEEFIREHEPLVASSGAVLE